MTESEVLSLIKAWQNGEPEPTNVLMELAYIKIKEYANTHYKNLPEDVNTAFLSLSVTDLTHDCYEKLLSAESTLPVDTLREFYSYLNSAVRNLFIDHYRKTVKTQVRSISKVSSSVAITQKGQPLEEEFNNIILYLEMDGFSKHYARQAEALDLRYFAQKSNKEIARLLGVSLRTVENDLRFAKAWLKQRMQPSDLSSKEFA
ncbi:sigma-70 family RNA polymerase sigma factor [Shewanella frigidimarina]|uniref:sigma-70 family RNA polymerase sigma factor n=1 Tax=Shewanella frigidimarina TaxID=56812 RepID=UPI003D799897